MKLNMLKCEANTLQPASAGSWHSVQPGQQEVILSPSGIGCWPSTHCEVRWQSVSACWYPESLQPSPDLRQWSPRRRGWTGRTPEPHGGGRRLGRPLPSRHRSSPGSDRLHGCSGSAVLPGSCDLREETVNTYPTTLTSIIIFVSLTVTTWFKVPH